MDRQIKNFIVANASQIVSKITGSSLHTLFGKHALKQGIQLPHDGMSNKTISKTTLFKENLRVFDNFDKFCILKEILETTAQDNLHLELLNKFSFLDREPFPEKIDQVLLENTIHLLGAYPKANKPYEASLSMFKSGMHERNMLDNLRFALEELLRELLENDKSLENQGESLGKYFKSKNISKEFTNSFTKLIELYNCYQNNNVKHQDKSISSINAFIFELTSCYIKLLISIK